MSKKLTHEENGVGTDFLIWFVQNCITITLSSIFYC